MNITRVPSSEVVRFECTDPKCAETWFLILGPDGKPLGSLVVDDYHLGMMYRAAKEDEQLVQAISEATSTRVRS